MKIQIVNPIELMICIQCGAVVFAPMKNIHGKAHSTFGAFKEFPSEDVEIAEYGHVEVPIDEIQDKVDKDD